MRVPLFFEMNHKKIVIIGGGKVALRKVRKLVEYGADIYCISTTFLPEFDALKGIYRIEHSYATEYIEGALFVIAATSDKEINYEVWLDCKEEKILCCVADRPELSDVIFPASFHRGELTLAVGTEGNSPILAKNILEDLKQRYDESYKERVALLGLIRRWIIENERDEDNKKQLLQDIIDYDLTELHGLYRAMTKEEEI